MGSCSSKNLGMTRSAQEFEGSDCVLDSLGSEVLEVLHMAAVLDLGFVPEHEMCRTLLLGEVGVVGSRDQVDECVPYEVWLFFNESTTYTDGNSHPDTPDCSFVSTY